MTPDTFVDFVYFCLDVVWVWVVLAFVFGLGEILSYRKFLQHMILSEEAESRLWGRLEEVCACLFKVMLSLILATGYGALLVYAYVSFS